MKVVVTGAAGMLGTALVDYFKDGADTVATDLSAGYCPDGVRWKPLDLLDCSALAGWLSRERPDVVVHCAALVNVDECERHPESAAAIHQLSTRCIADAISPYNGRLIYISTDSVFDGQKDGPYVETDSPNPLNAYASSKLAGEAEALKISQATVLRTNIFGWSRAEKTSFAEWVLKGLVTGDRLTMFTDVMYTPVHVSHLARIIGQVIDAGAFGLYHAAGSTVLSKHDFAVRLGAGFGLSTEHVVATRVDNSGLTARRPKNMTLDSNLLGRAIPDQIPSLDDGIALLKEQYDSGWLAAVKGRTVASGYRFWEK